LPLKVITFSGFYLVAFTIAIKATLETSIFVAFKFTLIHIFTLFYNIKNKIHKRNKFESSKEELSNSKQCHSLKIRTNNLNTFNFLSCSGKRNYELSK